MLELYKKYEKNSKVERGRKKKKKNKKSPPATCRRAFIVMKIKVLV